MKKLDFTTITTIDDFKEMSKEQYDDSIKKGLYQARKVRGEYCEDFIKTSLINRAHEIVYLSCKYKDETATSKQLMKSTIIYPDNTKTIQLFIDKGFSYENLYAYARLIKKLKSIALIIDELELSQEVDLATKKIAQMCTIFRNYYGHCDYQSIITKINEIVIFERDLYKKLEQKTKKEKTKQIILIYFFIDILSKFIALLPFI